MLAGLRDQFKARGFAPAAGPGEDDPQGAGEDPASGDPDDR